MTHISTWGQCVHLASAKDVLPVAAMMCCSSLSALAAKRRMKDTFHKTLRMCRSEWTDWPRINSSVTYLSIASRPQHFCLEETPRAMIRRVGQLPQQPTFLKGRAISSSGFADVGARDCRHGSSLHSSGRTAASQHAYLTHACRMRPTSSSKSPPSCPRIQYYSTTTTTSFNPSSSSPLIDMISKKTKLGSGYNGGAEWLNGLPSTSLMENMEHQSQSNDLACRKHLEIPAEEFAQGCKLLQQAALGNLREIKLMMKSRINGQHFFVTFRDYDRRTAL